MHLNTTMTVKDEFKFKFKFDSRVSVGQDGQDRPPTPPQPGLSRRGWQCRELQS